MNFRFVRFAVMTLRMAEVVLGGAPETSDDSARKNIETSDVAEEDGAKNEVVFVSLPAAAVSSLPLLPSPPRSASMSGQCSLLLQLSHQPEVEGTAERVAMASSTSTSPPPSVINWPKGGILETDDDDTTASVQVIA